MKKFLWIIIKIIGFIILLIITAVIAWVLYNLNDEKIDPKAAAFFHDDVVNDKENGFIALSGITAPEGTDIFEYGKKVQEAHGDNPDKNEIAFKGDANSFDCWITQHGKEISKEKGKPCASVEQLEQTIKDNQLLLKRYVSLRKYGRFVTTTFSYRNNLLIRLNELYLARLSLLVEQGKSKEAMEAWLVNINYLQKMMIDKQNMLGKSAALVMFGFNEKFLPIILEKQPNLAKDYYTELHKILDANAFGAGGWDVAATMGVEYEQLKEQLKDASISKMIDEMAAKDRDKNLRGYGSKFIKFLFKENNTTNSFYHYAADMVELSKESPEKLEANLEKIKAKYPNNFSLWNLLYNPIGNLILTGAYIGEDLIAARLRQIVYLKMLSLYMEAKIYNIPNIDMPEFIKNSDKKFQNPLTNQPFLWDSKTNSIYNELIENAKVVRRFSIFY